MDDIYDLTVIKLKHLIENGYKKSDLSRRLKFNIHRLNSVLTGETKRIPDTVITRVRNMFSDLCVETTLSNIRRNKCE